MRCFLLSSSWQYFDEIANDAPASLRKGPRGGGRDRESIREHVLESEQSYGAMLGITRKTHVVDRRDQIIGLVRPGGEPVKEKGWPLRYAVRRIAWHCLDHAWEIEDRSQ
ncbi:hypothetical protein BH18ACT5_BH18ACT5_12570 [soil metagenome]